MAEQLTLRGTLKGHNGWVTQIATTPQDPNQILSASRDKTLILWELTHDEMNYGVPKRCLTGHNHFVSDVVMSSDGQFALSGSWDKTLRLWDLNAGVTITVSPDGSLCASGGKDGKAMLWDLNEGKHLYTLEGGEMINTLTFSPNRYWLCAASGPAIKIWDLESKSVVDELKPEVISLSGKAKPADCISLAWSADGQTLFAGYTDNLIRVWQVSRT